MAPGDRCPYFYWFDDTKADILIQASFNFLLPMERNRNGCVACYRYRLRAFYHWEWLMSACIEGAWFKVVKQPRLNSFDFRLLVERWRLLALGVKVVVLGIHKLYVHCLLVWSQRSCCYPWRPLQLFGNDGKMRPSWTQAFWLKKSLSVWSVT